VIEPAFSETEKLALAGFLAGYSGMTCEAYTLDLRQFTAWCRKRQLRLFAVRRADIELFARDLEAAGTARATITRRLSTIAGLYKYAVEEDLLDHSPAVHVRRPRIDDRRSRHRAQPQRAAHADCQAEGAREARSGLALAFGRRLSAIRTAALVPRAED
jgi:site-specific recombinase XerD